MKRTPLAYLVVAMALMGAAAGAEESPSNVGSTPQPAGARLSPADAVNVFLFEPLFLPANAFLLEQRLASAPPVKSETQAACKDQQSPSTNLEKAADESEPLDLEEMAGGPCLKCGSPLCPIVCAPDPPACSPRSPFTCCIC